MRARTLSIAASALLVAGVLSAPPDAGATPAQVLRVGSFNGIPGNVATLDAAVAELQPGGWILVAPGDYKPAMDYSADQRTSRYPAAVLISVPDTHLRGMNRNTVIIDGTKAGAPACSSAAADQNFGPLDSSGNPRGRNGVEANVSGVSFDNFTTCNFLAGSADSGNEVWWNGGDDGGHIGIGSWWGSYLSATSTYFGGESTAATYGLFVSNSDGPGAMDQTYSSNFSDSGYYIGACPNCNAVINHAHAEYNALGYSGTNSGGNLIIENSEWDNNKTGLVSNSQNSADPPSPQDGACPGTTTGPTGTHSCWVFEHNYVHDNNDPNVPAIGDAAIGPVGAGIVLAGDRNNTITGNLFANNKSWAVLTTLFPDTGSENPNNVSNCHGGLLGGSIGGTAIPCLFDDWGNQVIGNAFSQNGGYRNLTNGDLADLSILPVEKLGAPGNCFHGNTEIGGGTVTTWPAGLQKSQASCSNPLGQPNLVSTAVLLAQVGCATQALFKCPTTTVANYPRQTQVVMHPLPAQATMPNPCAGVPVNPWCPSGVPATPTQVSAGHTLAAARLTDAVRVTGS